MSRIGIDLEELRQQIRIMTRKHELYRVLKEELSARGHWKAQPRGNPAAGYQQQRERLGRANAPSEEGDDYS